MTTSTNRPLVTNSTVQQVIVTDGPRDVYFCSGEALKKFPVSKMDESLIVDDNGAGDSFAGAFLACYTNGGIVEDCG